MIALSRDDIHVWRASLNDTGVSVDALERTLSDDERLRAQRFHFQEHRKRFVSARGILRLLLGRYLDVEAAAVRFAYNAYGKPALAATGAALKFNVSHSGSEALFAFADGREVGIDIEKVRPELAEDRVAAQFFSPRETAALRDGQKQSTTFFSIWTLKEAYIKARGEGLSFPLDRFDVLSGLNVYDAPEESRRWSLKQLTAVDGFAAALAAEGHDWQVKDFRWPP